MGKTFKDRDKWERKRERRGDEDQDLRHTKKGQRKRYYEAYDPDGEVDPYGDWDDADWDR
jgi:hypothetical protein